SGVTMQPVPRSFQAHRPVLDEAWPAQPPGSPRYDPKQNFRLPLELEILTNRRCAPGSRVLQRSRLWRISDLFSKGLVVLPRSADLVETSQIWSQGSHFKLRERPSSLITTHQPLLASATTLADDPKVGGDDLNNPV